MVIQEDIEQYDNFLQGDSNFVEPFLCGSQNPSMPIQSLSEVEIVTSNSTKRGGNFSVDEDLLLVSAWLNISTNAMHGTEQKGEKFWEKIWQYFCENNTYGTTRSVSSRSSRWGNISRETSRFAGFMAKVEAQNRSDTTDEDKLLLMNIEHCWVVLKNQPKWSVLKERSKGIPQTPSLVDHVDSNDDDTVVLERPIGRKAEKAKRKRADGDKPFEDYLAKKLQYIQETHGQVVEALRIKANKVRVDAQRADIERERLRLETIKEEGRIMTIDTSGIDNFLTLLSSRLSLWVALFFTHCFLTTQTEDKIMRLVLKGSTLPRKHRRYIERDRLIGHKRLYLDYFANTPVYPPNLFRRRFQMSRSLFLRIQSKVETYESYFIQKRDNAQKLGLSSLQKITAALRMLAYGVIADFMDEYVQIGESTAIKSLKKFIKAVVDIFSKEYLRSPNNEDIARLLANGERRGFPRMLGSIDCMHWKWKNCPAAWKG
ncbi:hypothetical protein SO802_016411 [Lithocarpus litseifolius]|uniref:No apical meristem-associated C-terminal domain-containing protein n=1 Tax=Lithocarpus litseifolius TaxID=425828 RepID=A0AAW2CZW1_9ROSI